MATHLTVNPKTHPSFLPPHKPFPLLLRHTINRLAHVTTEKQIFMKRISLLFFAGIVATSIVVSCKKTPVTTATCTTTISYSADIVPILSQNCTSCHNSSNAQGGYNLTTHANVSSGANTILKSMRHSSGVAKMPQGSAKLPSTTVDKFDCWIQQGMPNN